MSRRNRTLGYLLLGAVVGIAIVLAIFFVLTRTEYGIEQVRRVAVSQIQQRIAGDLRIGRIDAAPGLLGGAILRDVEIVDESDRTFIRADSLRLAYNWRALLGGRIEFDRVDIFGAEVVIERLPGDERWNYARIFDLGEPDPDSPDRLIQFRRARIVDGLLVIRYPWRAKGQVERGDTARLILREVPGGLVRELRFEDINAVLPRVLWESPVEEGRLFVVDQLSTRGFVWEDPFEVRELSGSVTQRDSLVSFDVDRVRLPASTASGLGHIVIGEDRVGLDISIDGDDVSSADLQWLYPPLPDDGTGRFDFRIQSVPGGTLWLARDAYVSAPGTELAGSFGIVTGDTLYFTEVDLRASPLNLALLEELLPVELPIDGLLVGTVEVEGPISSLRTRGDVRLASAHGSEAARWEGTLDLRGPFGVQNFRADVETLDVGRLAAWRPELAANSGRMSGRIEATGRFDDRLGFVARLRHELEAFAPATIEASGTVELAGRSSALDVELLAETVDLEALGSFVPGLADLRGDMRGPVTITGTLDDLAVEAELAGDFGRVRLEGRADLARDEPVYRVEGEWREFQPARYFDELPDSRIDARFLLEGRGYRPETLQASLVLDVDSARIGEVELLEGRALLAMSEGVLEVDSMRLGLESGRVEARGTIGVLADQTGILDVVVDVDALAPLRSLVFPAGEDGEGPERFEGAGRLGARLEGSLTDLAISGEARVQNFFYDNSRAQRIGVTFTASGIGTERPSYRVHATADSLAVLDQHIGGATSTLAYADELGRLTFEAWASEPAPSRYRLSSDYRWDDGVLDLSFDEAWIQTSTETWRLSDTARARIGEYGIEIDGLVLDRLHGEGSVRIAGNLPWRPSDEPEWSSGSTRASGANGSSRAYGTSGSSASYEKAAVSGLGPNRLARFQVDIENFPIFALRRGPELRPAALAELTGRITVTGTADDPRLEANLGFSDARLGAVRFDRLDTRLAYTARRLDANVHAWLRGRRVLSGQGHIPLDLRLTPVAERRLDEPLHYEVRADGLPASILTSVVDGFHDVLGAVNGSVAVGGTSLEPTLGGELELTGGEATWAISGVRYRNVEANFRVLGEQIVAVEASARTGSGRANITGAITFRPISDPFFDLRVVASEFEAARRRDVEVTGTGEVHLGGRFSNPILEGDLHVDRGVLYVDEIVRQNQIVSLDDEFLLDALVDTTEIALRRIRPFMASPFLKNLEVREAQLTVDRDTWLRGRNLNVEVTGGLQVDLDMSRESLQLTGSLQAIRGYYELYLAEAMPVRRFAVRSGSVDFDGTPGVNPALNISTAYRVRTQRAEPLDVYAEVTGTLQNPRVALRSDIEPPISESDLMSYVIFGRPTYELAGPENQQLGTALALTNLGVDVLERSVLGYAAAGLESFVSTLGIVDYVAITEWEGATGLERDGAGLNLFARSQVEVGRYLGENWYIALSRRFTDGGVGGRLEWRFLPTWTAELFYEDRFARRMPYGLEQPIGEGDKIRGFFLFREWGF